MKAKRYRVTKAGRVTSSLLIRRDLLSAVKVRAAMDDCAMADVIERAVEMYLLPCERDADEPFGKVRP